MSDSIGPRSSVVFVDLQYDFTRQGGICYTPRSSVRFVSETLIPFVERKSLRSFEIVSDYRQPRRGDKRDCCRPGEWGFESEIPHSILAGPRWLKCMNSPIWVRDGLGDPNKSPGEPYQDPVAFDGWLDSTVGPAGSLVILAGLSLDACVLCVAQELTFRGYDVRILKEGTDTRSGRPEERDRQIVSPPVSFWSKPLWFAELKAAME